jgi:cytochrome c-type biogenesis protein CcmE
LDGPEEKLIPLVDAILFYCRVARLRTRPVRITEAEGCVTLRWSRYAPAVFRNNQRLALVAGGELIDHLTVQESRVLAGYAA